MSFPAKHLSLSRPLSLLAACAVSFAHASASPDAEAPHVEGDRVVVRALRATLLKARAADSRELDASEKCAVPEGAVVTLSVVEGTWDGRVKGVLEAVEAPGGQALGCALGEVHAYGPAFASTSGTGAESPAVPPLIAPAAAIVLEATLASVVKAQPVDSKDLPPSRKCNAPVGSRFTISGVSRGAGHFIATSIASAVDASGAAIACSLAPAYLYDGHFRQISGPAVPGGGGAPGSSGFAWPTRGRGIRNDSGGAGHFGAPRGGRTHTGIDILASVGEPLFAAAAGSLVTAGWAGGYGNLMQLSHAGARMTAYAHLSSFVVRSRGAWVGAGERVALAGRTGNADSPAIRTHLHFEILENGTPVDPIRRLPR